MPVRVSQRSIFNNFMGNMNNSLTTLMDLNNKSSSQKKINKPSDDPVGTARVLNYRHSLQLNKQYRENADTAKGWLGTADSTLMQVSTVLTRTKELAEQAASGTMSKSNREQVSFEIRELFEQLINLSNTEFEGRHTFAGHKTDQPAFEQGLSLTTNDPAVAQAEFSVKGAAASTVLIQIQSGASGNTATVGTDPINYRYTTDGGDTWTSGTTAAGSTRIDAAGVRLELEAGTTLTAVNPNDVHETDNGSWLWVRPAAVYMGDDTDAIEVDALRPAAYCVQGEAEGFFNQNVVIRIDNEPSVNLDGAIEYSYSTDGGNSWTSGNVMDEGTASAATLSIPGGFLTLYDNGSGTLNSGDQFLVRPRRAELKFEVSDGEYISVNNVGKDVFGGIYTDPNASNATASLSGPENVMETVAELLAYIETNNQSGIQRALENLDSASNHIMTVAASVGGRENRLEVTMTMLENLKVADTARMSKLEDIDVAELMTQLAQQNIVYQSVLKSSSMIMQMNLSNFI